MSASKPIDDEYIGWIEHFEGYYEHTSGITMSFQWGLISEIMNWGPKEVTLLYNASNKKQADMAIASVVYLTLGADDDYEDNLRRVDRWIRQGYFDLTIKKPPQDRWKLGNQLPLKLIGGFIRSASIPEDTIFINIIED